MTVNYYLFLDKEYNTLISIFNNLVELETRGIIYKYTEQNGADILPSRIVIESVYKDLYFKRQIKRDVLSL